MKVSCGLFDSGRRLRRRGSGLKIVWNSAVLKRRLFADKKIVEFTLNSSRSAPKHPNPSPS